VLQDFLQNVRDWLEGGKVEDDSRRAHLILKEVGNVNFGCKIFQEKIQLKPKVNRIFF
jgi:hypothetical protein